MPEGADLLAGRWWRFSAYEIRESWICPAKGARLEAYDPWLAYHAAREGGGWGAPPYQSLLELIERLSFRPRSAERPFALAAESEQRLLAWCREHGLLGVLPHRVQAVVLAPRWRPLPFPEAQPEGQGGLPQDRILAPILPQYFRTSDGWQAWNQVQFAPGRRFIVDEPERAGELVSEDDRPKSWPPPSVLLQNLRDFKWERESLGKTWAQFFPDVPGEDRETHLYPVPGNDEFCRRYAEPWGDFWDAGRALRDAAGALSGVKPPDDCSQEELQTLGRGMRILNVLVSPVRSVLTLQDDGSFGQLWAAPSLLASYAMMVLQDLTARRKILRCEVCGRIFVSTAYQARYCSARCRYTAQKRAYRKRLHQKTGKNLTVSRRGA